MRSPLRFVVTAAVAAGVLALGEATPAAALVYDLNNGTIDNGVKFDSGPISIAVQGAPQIVLPQFPSLEVSIVFKDHQLLRLTDTGSDTMPALEEQILAVKFTGPGDAMLKPEDVVELNATIAVTLTGLSAAIDLPNPFDDDAVCTVSQGSTECTNISIGFGDLTNKSVSFKDIHLKLTIDPAQVAGGMFNGMGGSVANLKFDAVQWSATGDQVERGVPGPPTLLLLAAALALLGYARAPRS